MSSRTLIRVALVMALLGSSPAVSHAQLKDVQDNGWSTLQDAYTLVKSMMINKEKRNGDHFSKVLEKSQASMEKMKGYIEKMGAGVADEDKSVATEQRGKIMKEWNAVDKARDKLKKKYDTEKERLQGNLTTIKDELEDLQIAMEAYEHALSKAFAEYAAKWQEIKDARSKLDAVLMPAVDKMKGLLEKYDKMYEDVKSISLDRAKASIEHVRIQKEMNEAAKKRVLSQTKDDRERAKSIFDQLEKDSATAETKFKEHDKKYEDLKSERKKVLTELEAVAITLEGADAARKLFDRFDKWEKEFPKEKMKFQSLK